MSYMLTPSVKAFRFPSVLNYATLAPKPIKKLLLFSARSRRITDWGILFIDLFDIIMGLIRMEKYGEIIIWERAHFQVLMCVAFVRSH